MSTHGTTADGAQRRATTTSHWGAYSVRVADDAIVELVPHPDDPDPSPLLGGVVSAARHPTRVHRPAVRRSWLERGPGRSDRRGHDEFVELEWDHAADLVAAELQRVRTEHGNESIFGGSYGWASAGRFHHAQSQLHRLLNLIGGFTRSIHSYSNGTSAVLLPHLVGDAETVFRRPTSWPSIIEHTDLIVAFGGIPAKNVFVTPGGVTSHHTAGYLDQAAASGTHVALVSPIREDLPAGLSTTWLPVVPGSDVALMLALAHTLFVEGLADRDFLQRCTAGADTFEAYVLGTTDGIAKDPGWAGPRCGIPPAEIRSLARRMAAGRTLVTVTWSLQRARFGEQPVWAGLALAAVLGQIGLPGGGFGHGYGSMGDVGSVGPAVRLPALDQGRNPVAAFIPVARIADMLLHPGETFDFNGATFTYPDTRLVYWAGGNPFHHHQDLGRLQRALSRVETVVVNEPYWTAMARHADIVLPTTIPLERDDIGGGRRDTHLIAMQRAVDPPGEALDDHAIFALIAGRLGVGEAFTEQRTPREWLEHMYSTWRDGLAVDVPTFEEFWDQGGVELPFGEDHQTLFESFRKDPDGSRLATPSGRIELASDVIASFGYGDCPGHPAWLQLDGAGDDDSFPLHLIANQPSTRLHGQLDVGDVSVASKIDGREPILVNPVDASARGIVAGDVVQVVSSVGRCLAGAVLSSTVRPGVVQLSTGAWFDPLVNDDDEDAVCCAHGNPNALTTDMPTSRLAQGCTGQHVRVEIERHRGPVPPITVHRPPVILDRTWHYNRGLTPDDIVTPGGSTAGQTPGAR